MTASLETMKLRAHGNYPKRATSSEHANASETNNNDLKENNACHMTPIQEFYNGETVFITGGTGFLGKVLIEKLLRTCAGILKIYLLARPKKGKSVESRIEDMLQSQVFDRLKNEVPGFRKKIVAINGDCSMNGLGLTETDRELLINETSIVFHAAATVRFNEKLKTAAAININGTVETLNLCKQMQRLKSFIHVSTAYSNCHIHHIEESFYDYPIKYDELTMMLETLPECMIEDLTSRIVHQWSNTYTFTKAMAEMVIRENNTDLPMGIFRPGIVISTAKEPEPGWIDNFYGPTGVTASVAGGLIRFLHCDPNVTANIIPVDITTNALIASAWDVFQQKDRRGENMMIYNAVWAKDNPLSWGEFNSISCKCVDDRPLSNCIWYPHLTFVTNKFLYTIAIFMFHLLPALLVDWAFLLSTNKKPRMFEQYKKIHKFNELLSHFCLKEWDYTNTNVQILWQKLKKKDQQLFNFNMKELNWNEYLNNYFMGLRTHLLKEHPDTIKSSQRRLNRLYWTDRLVKALFVAASLWMLWYIFCT